MAFFSNIFGSSSAPASETSAASPATSTQNAATPANQAASSIAGAAEVSPMDAFKALWEPVETQGTDTTLPQNIFAGADPTKMLEAARKVDFSKSIPPEVLSKITAGGPEAATAFAAALNDVAQRSYAQSSFAATKMIEQALARFQEGIDNRLPGQIKKHSVSDTIRESNPALMHPAATPIMEALQAQMTVKYPNATVSEIKDLASQFLTAFASSALPKPAEKAVPASENWDAFFA